jgi:DtxR family Mn-dependent transcriptional regulator
MKNQEGLTASQKDYLEAIYQISCEKKAARAKEISEILGVRASSVTGALRMLRGMGLINYTPYDEVTLTGTGRVAAEKIVKDHKALQLFLTTVLGVELKEADAAAGRMERFVPDAIIERLGKYAEEIEKCPANGLSWDEQFGSYHPRDNKEMSCRTF